MSERMVYVYKSSKKLRTYLYIERKDDFSKIPGAMLEAFGNPKFMMAFMPQKHKVLQKISREELLEALDTRAYEEIRRLHRRRRSGSYRLRG